MPERVLHVLSQRPSLTGSGVTLDALVRHAAEAGWEQAVVVGVPGDDPSPQIGALPEEQLFPLVFGGSDLPVAVPGMSDIMPYPSSRFSALTTAELDMYRQAWRRHLRWVVETVCPDVVHTHHIWLMSSLLKDIAPDIPVVTQSHATGLRQMILCPGLADEVRRGVGRNDAFLVLHDEHADLLGRTLAVPSERIEVVGAGYREDLFHARGRELFTADSGAPQRLLYVGKYSAAKGLPWLLDAFSEHHREDPRLELHVAGSGAGKEANDLEQRMVVMAPAVVLHGQLDQPELATLMRRCTVCVLPSFYEGVPLVLVEAVACGCRLVTTRLPGVLSRLAPGLAPVLELVPLPRLRDADRPFDEDLPTFVHDLRTALARALSRPPLGDPARTMAAALAEFSWR
ncbi:MAG: glycosyltransferase family 4 protein, partial [bacterium]